MIEWSHQINRLHAACCALFTGDLVVFCCACEPTAASPNVAVILADKLRSCRSTCHPLDHRLFNLAGTAR